jgi:hypothetical protein
MELQLIRCKIHVIRWQKVMLDFELAALYEVQTKVLNQAVKRNIERFPEDFMFQLSKEEWHELRAKFANSDPQFKKISGYKIPTLRLLRAGSRYVIRGIKKL